MASDDLQHALEEYKHITSVIRAREQQIIQLFAGAVAVSVSLLAGVSALALGGNSDYFDAYAALAPNLITIPALFLLGGQRGDVVRLGTYCQVFFAERNRIDSWETRLARFRRDRTKGGEANDTMPWAFWSIYGASILLFVAAIADQYRPGPVHILIPLGGFVFLLWGHVRWRRIVPQLRNSYLDLWRSIAASSKAE